MEENLSYEQLFELFKQLPKNFNVLPEEINMELQMEYFEFSRNARKQINKETSLSNKDLLFEPDFPLSEKKTLLAELACIDDVSAFRSIEKYYNQYNEGLHDWALLAMQESRMLIQTSLLDDNQVFISTGLGGKGTKIRYFVVLPSKGNEQYNDLQKKLISSEFKYVFESKQAEVEEVLFYSFYCTITALVPFGVPIPEIFENAVKECNQYGNFISTNFIVTNVKRFSEGEIEKILKGEISDSELQLPGLIDEISNQ